MFATLWARFSQWIIGVLILLAGVAAVYFKGRTAGKAVEQKKATERDLTEAKQHAETIRETVDVQAEVSRLPDSDVRQRLRKFTRDN
jgi:uncharacterized membrane-anchored protein YhcB (DUF1043 family)